MAGRGRHAFGFGDYCRETVVRTMADIGTTTAKNPASMPFLEADATFDSGLEAHNTYYAGYGS